MQVGACCRRPLASRSLTPFTGGGVSSAGESLRCKQRRRRLLTAASSSSRRTCVPLPAPVTPSLMCTPGASLPLPCARPLRGHFRRRRLPRTGTQDRGFGARIAVCSYPSDARRDGPENCPCDHSLSLNSRYPVSQYQHVPTFTSYVEHLQTSRPLAPSLRVARSHTRTVLYPFVLRLFCVDVAIADCSLLPFKNSHMLPALLCSQVLLYTQPICRSE